MGAKKKTGKKSRKWIIVLIIALLAAGLLTAAWFFMRGRKKAPAVQTEKVSDIMGGASQADVNRFAGVVESKKSWSVKVSDGSSVGKVLVKVGDEVTKGTPLFTYDTQEVKNDLTQAQIDLQRLQNEQKAAMQTIAQLQSEKNAASAADQGSYTIQIQEQQLEADQKEIEIKEKQKEVAKLQASLKNTTVKSKIDGVVKSINRSQAEDSSGEEEMDEDMGSDSEDFMTIMQTNSLRIKASVNEQNISNIEEGMSVTVHSRVDETTWSGTISKIDTESAAGESGEDEMEMGMDEGGEGDEETASSSYPFYVDLESSDGLMLGQHVYVEPAGAGEAGPREGIWLDESYIAGTDTDEPYVWAANGRGRIKKRPVTLGDYDDQTMEYEIKDGLTREDKIALPDDTVKEGAKTK